MKYELRYIDLPMELAGAADQKPEGLPTLRGYAAVFDSRSSDLGGFVEIIKPGAFRGAIQRNDVVALVNHDTGKPLGRMSNGRLRLVEDERGLRAEIDASDTSYARDLIVSIRDGNVKGMSFRFRVPEGGDKWRMDGKTVIREVIAADVDEVSAVTFPAYPATTIEARHVDIERAKIEIEKLNTHEPQPEAGAIDVALRLMKARIQW